MADITVQPVEGGFKSIPLWKIVDANYELGDYTDENFVHHNGFLKIFESTDFSKLSTVGDYDIYGSPAIDFVYSSLTAALYGKDPMNAQYEHTLVTEFTAYNQFKIEDGLLYISIPTGWACPKVYMSPSDYTRIDAGSQMALGLKTFENVVPGCKYNNDLCIGYIDTTSGSLYGDSGEIISPTFVDTTDTFDNVFGTYARGAERPIVGETIFKKRRIAMTEREVSAARGRALSHCCFVRLGDDNGTLATVDWSIIHPLDIYTDFATKPIIETEFKSTPSGAYLFVKNNNTFDIFIHSIEIWGLWGVKQSTTGAYGGAVHHASYNENTPSKDNVVNIDNPFITTHDQAKEVADFYLDIGTKKRFALSGVECPHARYLEIGDRIKAQINDIGSQTGIFIVVGKTIKDDIHVLILKMIGTE